MSCGTRDLQPIEPQHARAGNMAIREARMGRYSSLENQNPISRSHQDANFLILHSFRGLEDHETTPREPPLPARPMEYPLR